MLAWERMVNDLIAGFEHLRDGTAFGRILGSSERARLYKERFTLDRRIEILYRAIGHKVYQTKKSSSVMVDSDSEMDSLLEEIHQLIIDRDLVLSEINNLE